MNSIIKPINNYTNDVITKSADDVTKMFKLSDKNDNSDVIEAIVPILQRGGVVALPTDTIYGVACLAQCSEAVKSLYDVKKRDLNKPIAICVGGNYDVCQWVRFPPRLLDLIADISGKSPKPAQTVVNELLGDFFPGPVTIVTERSQALNSDLNPKTSSVAIRVPDHDFIRDLTNRLREPLALTSANISGDSSATCINDFKALWPRLDAVVDGGEVGCKYAPTGSTICKLLPDGKSFKILRTGCAYEATVKVLKQKWKLQHVI